MKAYVTILGSKEYLPGVLSLLQSLREVRSIYPVFVLSTVGLSASAERYINGLGGVIIAAQNEFNIPEATLQKIENANFRYTFAKVELYSLPGFQKIVYLDADMLVCRNIDHLFDMPHLTFSTGSAQIRGYEDWTLPNSGLMILEPKPGLSAEIFKTWPEIAASKPDFSDQDLLHAYFKNYFAEHREWKLSTQYNCFVFLLDAIIRERNFNMNFISPDSGTIYVLHFALRGRPWQMSFLSQVKYMLSRLLQGKKYEVKAFLKYRRILNKAMKKKWPLPA